MKDGHALRRHDGVAAHEGIVQPFEPVGDDLARHGIGEGAEPYGLHVVDEARDGGGEPAVADGAEPGGAEAGIGQDQLVDVVVADGLARLLDGGGQFATRRVVEIARGVGRGAGLEQAADLEDFPDVVEREARHREAARGADEIALVGEPQQRLAHRHAGRAVGDGDLGIDQPVVGADFAALQAPAEIAVDALAQAVRLDQPGQVVAVH